VEVRTGFLIIALLSVGPLALPLVWFHPRRTLFLKFLWTVAVLLATVVFGYMFRDMWMTTLENLKVLKRELGI
jgi:hypothetical protein